MNLQSYSIGDPKEGESGASEASSPRSEDSSECEIDIGDTIARQGGTATAEIIHTIAEGLGKLKVSRKTKQDILTMHVKVLSKLSIRIPNTLFTLHSRSLNHSQHGCLKAHSIVLETGCQGSLLLSICMSPAKTAKPITQWIVLLDPIVNVVLHFLKKYVVTCVLEKKKKHNNFNTSMYRNAPSWMK
jgi:hypothetical protein